MGRRDRWALAGVTAAMLGGMIAAGYGQNTGVGKWTLVAILVSHAACIFFPYATLLRLQDGYGELERQYRDALRRWDEERQTLVKRREGSGNSA